MKTVKQMILLGAVTALGSFGTAYGQKAELEVKADKDKPAIQTDVDVKTDRDVNRDRINRDLDPRGETKVETRLRSGVMKAHKASGLIGMEVKNTQNEKLGSIKDVVMDLPSGKVSYAVLAVGGFLGLGEKLLAIPPSAFELSDDKNTLILNADRSKIEGAPGFAATNWPEVDNPSWSANAAFWTDSNVRNLRDDGKLYREREVSSKVDLDRDRKELKSRVDLDKDDGEVKARVDVDRDRDRARDRKYRDVGGGAIYTDAARQSEHRVKTEATIDTDRDDKEVEVRAKVKKDAYDHEDPSFRGTVKSVNVKQNTLTVIGKNGETKTFKLDNASMIHLDRNKNAKLIDLRPGYNVEIGYHTESDRKDDKGLWTAHHITRID